MTETNLNEPIKIGNRILKSKLNQPVSFNDNERIQLKDRKTGWTPCAERNILHRKAGDDSQMIFPVGSKEIRWDSP